LTAEQAHRERQGDPSVKKDVSENITSARECNIEEVQKSDQDPHPMEVSEMGGGGSDVKNQTELLSPRERWRVGVEPRGFWG